MDLDNLAILNIIGDVPRNDSVSIIRLVDVYVVALEHIVGIATLALDGNLVVFVGATVQDKNSLVIVLFPIVWVSNRIEKPEVN